jgi:hypothetical protein
MYLSPAVRTMRDDPTAGAQARLVIRLQSGTSTEAVRDAVVPLSA